MKVDLLDWSVFLVLSLSVVMLVVDFFTQRKKKQTKKKSAQVKKKKRKEKSFRLKTGSCMKTNRVVPVISVMSLT